MADDDAEPLVCPGCATTHGLEERFCPRCGMPLVYAGAGIAGEGPITEQHERARKIKPQFAEGRLVRVVGASNQTEAEFIQGLLLEEGVPSLLRRTMGFDVPDFLAAGPREVLVPESGEQTAREVLLQADMLRESSVRPTAPGRVLLGLLAALLVVALVAFIGTELLG